MKLIRFLFVLMIFITRFYSDLTWGQGNKPSGELQITKKTFNFGIVPEGQLVEHIFTLRNVGTEKMEITLIRPDCCSFVNLSKSSLEPKGISYLTVSSETYDKEGFFLQTIYIHTDSPKTPFDYIRLFGIVKKTN